MIAEALPKPLCETAYALACEVAAADGDLAIEELNLLSGCCASGSNVDRSGGRGDRAHDLRAPSLSYLTRSSTGSAADARAR